MPNQFRLFLTATAVLVAGLSLLANTAQATEFVELKTLYGHTAGISSLAILKTPEAVSPVIFSADVSGKLLAWDVSNPIGVPDWSLSFEPLRINQIKLSQSKKLILVGGNNGLLAVVDIAKNQVVKRFMRPAETEYMTVSEVIDDGWFLTGTLQGEVELWNIADDEPTHVWRGLMWPLRSVNFSRDYKLAIGAAGHQLRIWDLDSHILVTKITNPDTTVNPEVIWINEVTYSPEGAIFIASYNKVRGFDVSSSGSGGGVPFLEFTGHENVISTLAFSNQACCLLTASRDNFIKVWDIAAGQQVASIKNTAFDFMAASAFYDKYVVGAGVLFHNIRVWELR